MSKALIEKLENATEGSRDLDAEIMSLFHTREARRLGPSEHEQPGTPAKTWVWVSCETGQWISTHALEYTTSLDAAMTLVPEGWGHMTMTADKYRKWPSARTYRYGTGRKFVEFTNNHKSIYVALCIASLKARGQQT